MSRFVVVATMGLLVAGILAVVACDRGEGTSPTGAQEVKVTLTDFKFAASTTAFSPGVTYKLVVTSDGRVPHELMIMPQGEKHHHMALLDIEQDELGPGASASREFKFAQPGSFEFACHLPGHYEAGMVLPITVK